MKTAVNARPTEWTNEIREMWDAKVAPRFKEDESCDRANYFTPRPYVDEWNRATDTAGFVYVVQPGNRVCVVSWRV